MQEGQVFTIKPITVLVDRVSHILMSILMPFEQSEDQHHHVHG